MKLTSRPECEYYKYKEPHPKCEKVGIVVLMFTDLDTYEEIAVPVCGWCFQKAKIDSKKVMVLEAMKDDKSSNMPKL